MQFIQKMRGRNRIKALISIGLTISVLLAVFAIAGSFWVTRVVSDYAVKNFSANVEGTAAVFDREITHFETIAAQMSGAEWVRRVMFMQGSTIDKDRVSDFSLYESIQQIRMLKMSSSLISEIGVIFFEKDLVIANYGKSDLRFMAENAVCVQGMSADDWRDLGTTLYYGDRFQLDDVSISHYGVPSQNSLFIYPIQRDSGKRIAAALFVTVSHKSLSQFFAPLLLTGETQKAALTVSAGDADAPFLTRGELPDGKIQRVTAESTETGWTLAVELPESIVITGATRVRNILLFVVAVMWLVCMLASFIITNRIFFPIERIVSAIMGEDNRSQLIDEYDAIRKGIEKLQEQRSKLTAELLQRQPIVRAASLQALLTNDQMTDEELQKALSVLGIERAWKLYCVCMLLPMDMSPSRARDMEGLTETLATCPIDGLIVAGLYNAVPIALLCVDYKRSISDAVVEILAAHTDRYIVLGDTVGDARLIAHAFETTLIARDYRLVNEGFRLQRYDAALLRHGLYYLPPDSEYLLVQAIRNGNTPQALELFDNLYAHNESQAQITYIALRNFLMSIHMDIVKLVSDSPPGPREDALPAKWPEDAPLETICRDVRASIREVSDEHRTKIQAAPTRLEDIITYVQQNLHDSALSLTMVAEAFGVSTSVVSRLFSERHSENFLSYVNRLRIDYACECLSRDSQMDIRAIAKLAGYDNDVTFRRLFKKYVGLTPSEYRAKK